MANRESPEYENGESDKQDNADRDEENNGLGRIIYEEPEENVRGDGDDEKAQIERVENEKRLGKERESEGTSEEVDV